MADLVYKIGLLGPTRTGKTSLVASVLADAQRFLAGTPVSFVAEGPTRQRINANNDDLNGSLQAGTFEPGALAGSQEATEYDLSLEVPRSRLPVRILDYPGGWLTTSPPEFHRVREWFAESSVLVVPVDAVVAMECATAKERSAALRRLNVSAVEDAAQEWAKGRVSRGEPGTLLFVPVKCESYFADNGGSKDRSTDLYRRTVLEIYSGVFERVRAEARNTNSLRAYYMPVDTIGCVELVSTDWAPGPDGILECHSRYRVTNRGHRRVLGAGNVLVAIAKIIMEMERSADKGFFGDLWAWLTGTDRALKRAITDLNARDFGPRVRTVI